MGQEGVKDLKEAKSVKMMFLKQNCRFMRVLNPTQQNGLKLTSINLLGALNAC